MPLQFARGATAGHSIDPLAQMQSLQPIQPGRDLLPEGVGRPQEGRRQQSLLQAPDAHQGRVQPVVVGRAIEQGGMTASRAEADARDLRAELEQTRQELHNLRLEMSTDRLTGLPSGVQEQSADRAKSFTTASTARWF